MLTEGWDCNTVTHIVGLRPFMSQLLCEQVVGRGLRRASYEIGDDGKLTEEVAKVFGVPFEIIPFKQNKTSTQSQSNGAIFTQYRKSGSSRSGFRASSVICRRSESRHSRVGLDRGTRAGSAQDSA